jgi:hypothetical protein
MTVARAPRRALSSLLAAGAPRLVFAGVVSLGASGCGAALYQIDVITAETVVAEAEHAGAADLAPYEYYAAREYLAEAHHEASEAAYEDALRYAQIAGRLGREARRIAQEHREDRSADRDIEREQPGDR